MFQQGSLTGRLPLHLASEDSHMALDEGDLHLSFPCYPEPYSLNPAEPGSDGPTWPTPPICWQL